MIFNISNLSPSVLAPIVQERGRRSAFLDVFEKSKLSLDKYFVKDKV